MMWKSRGFVLMVGAAILFLSGAFLAGVYTGYENRPGVLRVVSLINKNPTVVFDSNQTDFSPYWKAWNVINDKYVGNASTTDQEKVWGSIQGLVGSLGDPYSVFFPPVEDKIFQDNIRGNFGGVGMEIGSKEHVLTVIAPLKDTPAEKAGIKAGDQILKIDKKVTNDLAVDEAVQLIRGEVGTKVTVTILSKNEKTPREVVLTRGVINLPTIDTKKLPGGIFVIKMYEFSSNVSELFRNALREFIATGDHKLIIDLRGNPGGYLEAAVDTASWFLPVGAVVVTEDFGGRQDDVVSRSRGNNVFGKTLKLVLLVNKGSASASEILAGALSENGVAELVGQTTFGKGSVQELVNITPDTSLKITVARWLTPKGNWISKGGIIPKYQVDIIDDDVKAGKDPQMDKAVEILRGDKPFILGEE